jgi:predicted ATP-grasp superfamily ATP-dependent carboligase
MDVIGRFNPNTTVLVAGLSWNGAGLLRNLSRKGYQVCGIALSNDEPGLFSRYGAKAVCPDPRLDQDAWVRAVIELARRCDQRPLMIPVSDIYVMALDRAAEELRPHIRFHGFGDGLRTHLTSKRSTFEMAAEHDFPAPDTIYVEDRDQLRRQWQRVQAPILIKPEFSKHWRTPAALAALGGQKAIIANSEQELVDLYDRVRPLTEQLMAQEVIPGPDHNLLYWAGFVGNDGRVGGRIVGRKIRVNPIHVGSASFVKLEDMPEIEANCESFLSAVGYRGICGIELKLDERDGVAKLIEVNPRYGLWDDIGVPEGVDLAEEAVLAKNGKRTEPRRPTQFQQKWIYVMKDVAAFRKYRAEGSLSLNEWLATLKRPILVADLPVFSDPYFACNSALSTLTVVWRRFLKRLRFGHGRVTRDRSV